MLNTLSIDMKIPNIQDFPQKYTVQALYLQNTPKTWGCGCFHRHSHYKVRNFTQQYKYVTKLVF